MSMPVVDFHIHTNCSDGSDNPGDIPRMAKSQGLKGICLTDHDCCDGLEEFMASAAYHGIEALTGIEISTVFRGIDVHILVFGLDQAKQRLLRPHLEKQWNVTRTRFELIRQQLVKAGYMADVAMEEIGSQTGSRGHYVSIMHIRAYLEKIGNPPDRDAFRSVLRKSAQITEWNARELMTPEEAIKMLAEIGGIPVLAHPGEFEKRNWKNVDAGKALRDVLDMLQEFRNKGIEAFHTEHSPEQRRFFSELARKRGFFITGGSDFHGSFKPGVPLGMTGVTFEDFLKLKRLCEA